jgi:hypothetical protein
LEKILSVLIYSLRIYCIIKGRKNQGFFVISLQDFASFKGRKKKFEKILKKGLTRQRKGDIIPT